MSTSSRDPTPASRAVDALRSQLETLRDGGAVDSREALDALGRLEQATRLLARVSENAFGDFEHRLRDLSLLQQVAELFASCFDLDRLCDSLLDLLGEEIPALWTAIFLAERRSPSPLLRRERGERVEEWLRALAREAAGLAVRQRRDLWIVDVRKHPVLRTLADPGAAVSLLCLPLLGPGDALGAILLADRDVHAFSVEQLRLLRPVSAVASVAFRHARLLADLMDRQHDLEHEVERRASALEEARTALGRHEKMASLGKLASTIAHEINNPMSYVLSSVRTARDYVREIGEAAGSANPDLEGRLRELDDVLEEVGEGLERIRSVAYELKGFGRSQPDATSPTDLNRCVETAVQIARAEAKDDVRIEQRLVPLPPLRARRYQIVQVVLNLLLNAIEAVGDSGSVRVSTGVRDDAVWVEVCDDGPGIAPEVLERIFDPFFTTKPEGNSGLGLAISRDIAEAHGGRLEVRSDPAGTSFRLTLPLRTPEESPRAPEASRGRA